MLAENWGEWGMHSGADFSNPPAFLSEQAKRALQFFANNPTLLSAIFQDACGKHMFGPFFVANANENTYGYLHTAGFNSGQMERLSAALSLCRHHDYCEAARDTFMRTVWQLIHRKRSPGIGWFSGLTPKSHASLAKPMGLLALIERL